MALGAITIAGRTVMGNKRVNYGTGVLTAGANYIANGEPVVPGDFGLKILDHLEVSTNGTNALAVPLVWDKANSTILAYESDVDTDQPLAEVGANDNFSTYIFNWKATGI